MARCSRPLTGSNSRSTGGPFSSSSGLAVEPRSRFGSFLERQSRHGIALDGHIEASSTLNAVLYVSYYGSFFASYREDGALQFIRGVVEAAAFPPVRVSGGIVRAPRPPPWHPQVSDVAADDDEIYILIVAAADGGKGTSIVDVYEASDGRYRASFMLPMTCRELVVAGDALFGLCGDDLLLWRTPSPAATSGTG